MAVKDVLKTKSGAELLSYIINQTPELSQEIDLPKQGESIQPIGQLIMSNQRYKNAFINTINLIGLTIINRNYWENPWEWFANKGKINFGQSVRELLVDIADVFDYNATVNNPTNFLSNVVPNVLQYIHELNYQKYYKTTTSDEQMAMAFATEDGLFDFIEKIIGSLYEAYKYDKYLVDKYQLCRRILDGTMTPINIPNYSTLSTREKVAFMKGISNKMTFRSPNYNPAGVRVANTAKELILILNTDFEANVSTEVLATSYFRDDAEFKTNLALIDGFGNHDTKRLKTLLGDAYIEFTSSELEALNKVPGVIISETFFQDYFYNLDNQQELSPTRKTEFFNPETLRNNHWLHTWFVISTSPFAQCAVFLENVTPSVTSVTVSPATATVSPGQDLQLSATVVTVGFANKAVLWSIDPTSEADGVTIDSVGKLKVPASATVTTITVTATSIFNNTKSGTASITVAKPSTTV